MGKILLATAILGLGIAGALFAIQQTALPENQPATTQSDNNNISNQPFVEKVPQSQSETDGNLTKTFNETLAEKIAAANPDGPKNLSGKKSVSVPDPDSVAQDLIVEAAKKFDPSRLAPVIKDSDLKISKDNSEAAVTAYINAFQKIVLDAANQIPDSILTSEPDLRQFSILSNIYKDTVNKFYGLSVPESAISIHKKQITLLTKKAYIFSAISNYKDDPLTTILVSPELEKIDREFTAFSEEFAGFIKKHSA